MTESRDERRFDRGPYEKPSPEVQLADINHLLMMRPLEVDWDRVRRESPDLVKLAESLRREGQQEPVIVRDGKIVDGIHRLFALWLMGYQGEVTVRRIVAGS